ncbi:MAG: hypothetical protein IH813_07410 [Thaumarchaeota archaeon]|nr:hypothetical protein [Nitrososphaerota archaeon]
MLNQAFTDIGGPGVTIDTDQIGAICLSAATPSVDETHTNTLFNAAHDAADTSPSDGSFNCITPVTGVNPVTSAGQVVTIGPLTFTASSTESQNWFAGDTVTHIGICDADSGHADVRGCTSTLFAVVNTSDVTLADTETVDVTYTFDISSTGT